MLLVLGYRDEYRAVALCLPVVLTVVLTAIAAKWAQLPAFSSARRDPAGTVRADLSHCPSH